MKKIILLFLFFPLFVLQINAQLQIDDIGRIRVGSIRPNQDRDTVANMLIFGNNGDYKAGGKLTFGDFGDFAYNGWNVFIGEYGSHDSDQLWLHGKYGIYMTYSNTTPVIAYYDINVGNRFNFNCDIYSSGIKLTSDERLKESIKPLENSLSSLRKLNGVSYYLKNAQPMMLNNKSTNTTTADLSEKEKKDLAFFKEWEKNLSNTKDLRRGFSAQELQKIFPDLVNEDKEGMLSVDYIGLIPIIVEAIKEQQILIDELRNKLESIMDSGIKSKSNYMETEGLSPESNISDESGNKATLYSNIPNPFNHSTSIKYYLPQTITTAYLCIYDLQGKQLKQITISERGEGSQLINGSQFTPGIYLYALIADGKEVDVKRMILTE